MGKPAVTEEEQKISPVIGGPSKDIVNALMQSAGVNPWDKEYEGPRMAAMNEAQTQAMDGAATRGNSMGFGFTPSSQSLPQSTMIDGMESYDTLAMARQGIPPELQNLYSNLYGDNGVLGKHRGGGGGGSQAPTGAGQGHPMMNYSRQYDIDTVTNELVDRDTGARVPAGRFFG